MTPEEQAAADAAAATAEAARVAAEQQTQQTAPAPVTVDGQTPEQIRERLTRLAQLEAAETQRAADAEAARVQSLSDVEREANRAQTAETEREAARTQLEAEITAANTLRLRIAAQEAARALGYTLHASALEDSLRLGDFESIQFNDAREPQGVSEAVKALVARKPYLVDRAEAVNLDANTVGRQGALDANDPQAQLASRALLRGF